MPNSRKEFNVVSNEDPTSLIQTIENPFEKGTAEQLDNDLLAYLFAQPTDAVYCNLLGGDNYKIIGGWGSGKTTLLKYIAYETQLELHGAKAFEIGFMGIYIKPAQSGFKPFLKAGGDFKNEGYSALFGHYLNLLILEKFLCNLIAGVRKAALSIPVEEEERFVSDIFRKFRPINNNTSGEKPENNFYTLETEVKKWRGEIETYINAKDLDPEISYDKILSIFPTSLQSFLNDVFQDAQSTIGAFSKVRFYILLDECDSISTGQQKIINTIIKSRFTTMVFKLATRPPDIKTHLTIEETVGLTDRDIKVLDLDELYDPASASFKDLCFTVAKKRLATLGHTCRDIRRILGDYTIEEEIGDELLSTSSEGKSMNRKHKKELGEKAIREYINKKYPNKQRIQDDSDRVYKDFKMVAAFQILKDRRVRKKYVGFETYVMLSSGIMLHFLELCRDAYNLSREKYLSVEEDGISFTELPLPSSLQNEAAEQVSKSFFNSIAGRAQSVKDSRFRIEFGFEIQYCISMLGGIFRDKLTNFYQPEAARIEIPEGIGTLDDSMENPIRQIFETMIAISVFQKIDPYMPRNYGGIKSPTYILNRILAPYLGISVRPRWSTVIHADTFNNILDKPAAQDFRNQVLNKRARTGRIPPKKAFKMASTSDKNNSQLTLQLSDIYDKMPLLFSISKKMNKTPFKSKCFLICLHFLRDLLPFIDACQKIGMNPSNTILFYKDYRYPNKEEIKKSLKDWGFKVFPVGDLEKILEMETTSFKDIIVIEDGGLIVPQLHNKFSDIGGLTIGAVEQTTRGVRNDQKISKLKFPIIALPGSELKNAFEPPHVARAAVNNLQRLIPNTDFTGKKVLVIGCGHIGQQLAQQLRVTLNLNVAVNDTNHDELLSYSAKTGIEKELTLDNIGEKDIVFGATGETVISEKEILRMKHEAYLVSVSSERSEFAVNELETLAFQKETLKDGSFELGTKYTIVNTKKSVNLLANGYPINFWSFESMPNEVSDLIMTLIFLATIEIAENRKLELKINSSVINDISTNNKLSDLYIGFHK